MKFISHNSSWTDFRAQLKKVSEELNIGSSELKEVNISHWEEIEEKVWKKFAWDKNARWIWESLKSPTYGFYVSDYLKLDLTQLVDHSEKVWFILDDTLNMKTKFWVYEGFIESFNKVIWECHFDEIIIVSKKYEWLITINHHDMIVGTDKLIDKLKEMETGMNS